MNILILCTGNSARSILGEALIETESGGRFTGFSAGSSPKGAPHPMALRTLEAHGHDASGYASKSWDVFAEPDAPQMDAVITVCDGAAAESCPVWPGAPVAAHWGLPDPAAAPESGQANAFEATYQALRRKVRALLAEPAPQTREALAERLKTI